MEGVDEASLQQVHDLNSAVTGATDQVVVGRVEGKAVYPRTVDWFKRHKPGHTQNTRKQQFTACRINE